MPQFDRKMTDFTIGYAPIDFERAAPEAQAAFQAALGVMKGLGAKFKEVEIPDFPYGALVETVIGAEAASIFEDFIRSPKIDQMADPSQAATLKAALDISAVDYLKAMRIRSLVRSAFREMFYDIDMLLAPSRMTPAPRIADGTDGGGGGKSSRGRTRSHGHHPRRQFSGAAGDFLALRIRGRIACRALADRAAMVRKPPARRRPRVSVADRLA